MKEENDVGYREKQKVMRLDLAFDVDLVEGGGFGVFEEACAHSNDHMVVFLFEDLLATVVEYELCRFFVRFECKLFRNVP